jgi:hypothetical protein
MYRTKRLLELKGIEIENDIEITDDLISSLHTEIISEVYSYEKKIQSVTNSKDFNFDFEISSYLNQLNYFRKNIITDFHGALEGLRLAVNKNLFLLESKFPLYDALWPHPKAMSLLRETFFDLQKTEESHYFFFRKSFIKEMNVVEFSVVNFGTLLVDIFNHSQEFSALELYESLLDDYPKEDIDSVYFDFLSQNILLNHSLIIK